MNRHKARGKNYPPQAALTYATELGPKFFIIGNWGQLPSSMATWKARGVNTAFTGTDDWAGNDGPGWRAACTTANLKMILRADHAYDAGASNTFAADNSVPLIITHSTKDEPDLYVTTAGNSPTELDAYVTTARGLGSTKPFIVNFREHVPAWEHQYAFDNATLNSAYINLNNINWMSSDTYAFTGIDPPYMMGGLWTAAGGTGPFTTVVGKAARTLRSGPFRTVAIAHPGRAVFQFLATGRINDVSPGVPRARQNATQYGLQFWSAVINGVSGIFNFSHYFPTTGSVVLDDTDATMANAIADAAAKIAILENQGGVNVLMDTTLGGRRAFTLRTGPVENSGTAAGWNYPTDQPSFAAPIGNQLPAWFEGCEWTVGAKTYRLVINLHDTLSKNLTDTAWGMSAVAFTPGQVMFFDTAAPAVNLFDTADSVPDNFSVPQTTNAPLDTDTWSVPVTPIGYTVATTITGNQLGVKIAGGGAVPSGTISPGQSFQAGRRSSTLFSTTSSMVGTVGGVAFQYDVVTLPDPSGGLALVGPHASWNFTTGLGAAAGTPITRTGPMSLGRFLTVPGQRVTGNIDLLFAADSFLGVQYVEFFGGCVTTQVSATTEIVRGTWPDGSNKRVRPHGITLNTGAYRGLHGTGNRVEIWARVRSNDYPNVQDRVVGPWWYHPEPTANDFSYTVNAAGTGGAKTTLKLAMDQAATDGAVWPLITINDNSFYELENTARAEPYPGGIGRMTITRSAGSTAKLGRAAINLASEPSWDWWPGWDGIILRNLEFDHKNFTRIRLSLNPGVTKAGWWDGSKDDNSIGDRDNTYFNKTVHPGLAISDAWYFTDHDLNKGARTLGGNLLALHGRCNDWYGDQYTGAYCVIGCRDKNNSTLKNSTFYPAANDAFGGPGGHAGYYPALTIWYTGTGTATMRKTQQNGAGSIYVTDSGSGAEVAFSLGAPDTLVNIQDVANWLVARGTGWHATVVNNSYPARALIGDGYIGGGGPNGFNTSTITSTPITLLTHNDVHGDFWQTANATYENVFFWDHRQSGPDNNYSSFWFLDGAMQDVSIKNCIGAPQQAATSTTLGGQWSTSHVLFDHNSTTISIILLAAAGGVSPLKSTFNNNTMYALGNGGSWGTGALGFFSVHGNFMAAGTPPTTANGSNYDNKNIQADPYGAGAPNWIAAFTDPLNDNFLPKTGHILQTDLVIPTWPYDFNGKARRTTGEYRGALAA